MAKKVNNRAHKRALKNAKRQNNKNILEKQIKKEKKELTESFAYQWELFSNDIQTKIRDIKKDINVSLAKVKFNFNSLFKNKTLCLSSLGVRNYNQNRRNESLY